MRRVLQLPVYRRLLGAYTLNELAWSIGTLTLAFLVFSVIAFGAGGIYLVAEFGRNVLWFDRWLKGGDKKS